MHASGICSINCVNVTLATSRAPKPATPSAGLKTQCLAVATRIVSP